MGFDGRVAIVTGASRGIGFATAVLLAAEGAHVIGVGRTPLERPVEGVTHVLADVLDEATPALVVEKAIGSYGRLDVLVNNAGTGRLREGYEQTLEADWRATWELLFLAPVRMTNAALPHLLSPVAKHNARLGCGFGLRPESAHEIHVKLPGESENRVGKVFVELGRAGAAG